MKKILTKKYMLIIIASIILIIGGILAFFIISNNNDKEELRLVNSKTSEYLLLNANKNISFEIDSSSESLEKYSVTNEDGENANARQKNDGQTITLKAPKGGYDPGEVYTLSLKEGDKFAGEKFADIKILNFKIYKKEVIEAKYNDNITQISKDDVVVNDNTLILNKNFNPRDIIVVDNGKDNVDEAYKINSINEENGKYTATYTTPKIDELYEDINICTTIISDGEYLEVNKEAAIEVAKQYGILDAFVDNADALTVKDLDIKLKEEKNKITVSITIKDPDNTSRSVTLRFGIKYENQVDISLNRQFVDSSISLTNDIEVSVKGKSSDDTKKDVEDAIENFEKDSSKTLGKEKTKKSEAILDIFSTKVPLWGTICFYVDFGLEHELIASAEINSKLTSAITVNQGILVKAGDVKKTYANIKPSQKGKIMLIGRLESFFGLGGELGIEILPDSGVGFRVSPGVYGDAKGYIIMEDITKPAGMNGYYDVEGGVKVKINAVVKLNYILDKIEYKNTLADLKRALFKYANVDVLKSVNIKKSYYLKNGKVDIGGLKATYLNVVEGEKHTEKIEKYKIYIDGKELKVKKSIIQKKMSEGNHDIKIIWPYNNQSFEYECKTKVLENQFVVKTEISLKKRYGPYKDSLSTYFTDVDIRIPMVQSSTNDYEKCNKEIRKYLHWDIDLVRLLKKGDDHVLSDDSFIEYKTDYQLHNYNNTVALVIKKEIAFNGSYYAFMYTCVYYDMENSKKITAKEYANIHGYSASDIESLTSRVLEWGGPFEIEKFNESGVMFYVDDNGKAQVDYSIF